MSALAIQAITPAERGFSKAITVSYGYQDIAVWVQPDYDQDERFRAICDLTGDLLHINGWLVTIEEGH